MDFNKAISFIFGGISSTFFMSVLYFFTSHGIISEIRQDIKEIHQFMKDVHEITHTEDIFKKRNR